MSKRLGEYLFFSVVSAGFFGLAFAAGFFARDVLPASILPGSGQSLALLEEARGIVANHYLGTLPDETRLQYGMIRGMLQSLNDPYTQFVEPSAHELESDDLHGEYGGIGVTLTKDEGGNLILVPFPNSPASQAGVLEGDRLEAVDGAPTADLSIEEISALVRGPVGQAVTITVRRGEQPLDFEIVRRMVEIPSVTWRLSETQPGVGVLAVSRFSEKTPDEIERGLSDLRSRGATEVILDLRNNGGGLMDSAIKVAAMFLDGGPVMLETRRDQPDKTFYAPSGGKASGVPLAVLVNHATASAAEIVAGALQDRGRSPLIGQHTFGKGSVQLVFEMSDGSSLHVTAAKWFTPDRNEIDGRGLTPDIEVQPSEDGSDAELARALEYLANGR